jgi:hypothetical protein
MLDAIDSKRLEGIFCGDLRHVPEGQARAMELLDDAYGEIALVSSLLKAAAGL